MSRVCQVTGKRPMAGNNVSHAKNRTRRRFEPNLHTHRFWVEAEKRFVKLRVSTKGMRIIVSGRLEQREYQNREGEKRTAIEINADEIGPSLRWATASVERTPRAEGGGNAGGGSRGGSPAGGNAGGGDYFPSDEEPF